MALAGHDVRGGRTPSATRSVMTKVNVLGGVVEELLALAAGGDRPGELGAEGRERRAGACTSAVPAARPGITIGEK